MKKSLLFVLLAVPLCMVLGMALVGCDSSDDDDETVVVVTNTVPEAAAEPTVTGQWEGVVVATALRMTISQNEEVITGQYENDFPHIGNLTGTVIGNAVDFTVILSNPAGWTVHFTGTANDEKTHMAGEYEYTSGGAPGTHTWSADKT